MQFTPEAVQQIANDPANAEAIRESKVLFQAVMQRSATDRAFRDQLIASPKEAIAEQYRTQFGKEIDSAALALDIRFVEPQGDYTYVLPNRVGQDQELSESELASVAGGVSPTLALVGSYAAGVAVSLGVVWAVEKLTD